MPLDLLLEIGTEDLPARYVVSLAEALERGVVEGLARRGVARGAARVFATPRRIAVQVEAVAEAQPEQVQELSGPALSAALKDGQPSPAALGFARKCGVEFAALSQKDGKLYFSKRSPGRAARELIPEIFEDSLKQMDELVPKRMRWGAGEETFVRPVEWMLCLFGTEVVPLRRFGLEAGRVTHGHRFHAPGAITLETPTAYADALLEARVWADVALRRAEIRSQIETAALRLGGYARITEALLDEVTALVELPVAVAGQFEARFLELPPEVIVATVETNQRYFTVFADAALTQLTRHFITVCNIESKDVAQVIAGNERVVRPRLTDALFFYQQDLREPLAACAAKLDGVTFQKELGSVGAKVRRIEALVQRLSAALHLEPGDAQQAARAAALCKGDLVTKVVYEFPELQGLMGGHYAAKGGEHAEVALAIREHYLPTQQGTPIPSSRAGQLVALADKLDSLAGIFAIGQKPSASKDPFALRRAALGVLRICIEGALQVDLRAVIEAALEAQPAGKRDATVLEELTEFVLERLPSYFENGLYAYEDYSPLVSRVAAVRATGGTSPLDLQKRFVALTLAQEKHADEFNALTTSHKRIRNILKQAGLAGATIDAARFEHASEHALLEAMDALAKRNAQISDYTEKLVNLASLRAPVDAFFESVMVNAENPAVRENRLALLKRFDSMCREVADLSCLPG